MSKREFISLINATATIVDGVLIVDGKFIDNRALCGARTAKKFAAGRVLFTTGADTSTLPTVTNTPAHQIAAMCADINTGRSELAMTFTDGVLSHVAVRHIA